MSSTWPLQPPAAEWMVAKSTHVISVPYKGEGVVIILPELFVFHNIR